VYSYSSGPDSICQPFERNHEARSSTADRDDALNAMWWIPIA
jgi:hypothetical protein